MVFTDIDASYGNRTIRYVIKTADQVDKAGFALPVPPMIPMVSPERIERLISFRTGS